MKIYLVKKFTSYRSTLQASEAAANNSDPHQTDPEALPTYNDQPTTIPSDHADHTILPEYPGQTILQEQPSDTLLPEYQDALLPEYQNTVLAGQDDLNTLPSYNNNLSPSAPPAEFALLPSMPSMPPMLPMPPTAEEGDAAAAMQALAAVAEAEEAARRSDQSGYEEPPSYEAAMGGNI